MWTPSQQTAIDAICADNLVSAAAGSGKTAVMVERIVNRVLSGKTDIDKILVVTFTNAAASEMKSRLMNSIMDSLETTDDPDRLNRQLMLINNAAICTIDSFCLTVLRNNFYKLNLDPGFKIADNAELELIKADVLGDIFEKYYSLSDEAFLRLVDCYSAKNDSELFELILRIFRFTNSMPGGADELDTMLNSFADNDVWQKHFVCKAKEICKRATKYYDVAIENCSYAPELEKIRQLLLDERNNFVLLQQATDWDSARKRISSFEFGRLIFPRGTTEAEKLPIKQPRDNAKAFKKELEEMFSESLEVLCQDCAVAYESLKKIVQITKEFAQAFADAKLCAGVVDFTDVEHMTLKLLMDQNGNPSQLASQLMMKFDEIYVDEYQDCNAVQEKLFSLISRANCGKPNVFMVGDMKQSIYGFRGSEPKLFKAKADSYKPYTDEGHYNKIVLNKNFRSRKTVIDAVNHIFSQIMSEKCGELDYNEEEYLYYNEDSYEDINPDMHKVDFVLMETDSALNEDAVTDTIEELKKTEAEAIFVANKINSIVNAKEPYMVFDKATKAYRPARYRDIAVLLRSGTSKAETFDRILTAAQIPVYCETGEAYFDTLEIVFLISFLKIIDNPYDDIALLSVMRHPVFSFDENDFVSIRMSKTRGYFYNSIRAYLAGNNNALSQKLKDFISVVKGFYDRSKYLSTDKLLWEIIRDIDYMSYLSFLPNAELKKANVKALISKAYDFERTSYKGVFDFIRYIDSLGKNNKDIESARILSDDEDIVRIMTIHKSKGLEFPIVFLCDASKGFNDNDITRSKVLMHRKRGFGLNFYDYENRYYYELPQKKLLKDVMRLEMLSEEMRILYVALTRPREKLFIVGSERNIASKLQKLSLKLLQEDYKLSGEVSAVARSYTDWILLSVLRDKSSCLYDKYLGYKTVYDSNGIFNVTLIHKDNEVLNVDLCDIQRDFSALTPDKTAGSSISDVLDFEYPYRSLADVPSNMSVTELKRRETEDSVYSFYKTTKLSTPSFYDGELEISPAQIGTLTHLVMEKLDFKKTGTLEEIIEQIDALMRAGFLTGKEAECIKAENIFRIFNTEIGSMIKKYSATVKREYSFKYLMNARDIEPDAKEGEKIVIQGMIDVYFEDDDGNIFLADYKTDKIKNNIEEIKERYAPQLKYYRLALQKALGREVSKSYLLLLDCGEAVEC